MVLLLIIGVTFVPVYAGTVFKCKEASGGIVFQDHACQGSTQLKKMVATSSPAAEPGLVEVTPVVPASVDKAAAGRGAGEQHVSSGKNFAWHISKGEQHGYLMGSIHFGRQEMYPLPAAVLEPYKAADALVVEANVLEVDQAEMMQAVMRHGVYSDGTTLQQALDADTWRALSVTAKSLNIPLTTFVMQRPWLASMTVTTLALQKMGLNEALGIDQYFLKQAQQSGKPIHELESVEQQLALLSGFPAEIQVAMLQQTLKDVADVADYFDTMLKAWQAGNPQAIDALFNDGTQESVAMQEFNRVMIDDRNVTMSQRIDALLRGGCRCFVVVGAGHLGGERGIIKLLQAQGYRAEQL